MTDARVFTPEELRVGALRSVDALAEALNEGDRDGARSFARRLRREALSMRVNYDGWEASLLESVGTLGAETGVREALAAIEASGGALRDVLSAPGEAGAAHALDDADAEGLDFGERWREAAREIDRAITAERDAEAQRLAADLHAEALRYHDRGMARVNALLSWLGRCYGPEALEQAYVKAMSADLLGDASFRERAEALMHFTRVHLQPFELEEDDEKLTFLCLVCPSGGRLLREGHCDPPNEALRVQGPSWLTWGRDELPVYCSHEPVMERSSIQKTGAPLFIVDPSERLGVDPCKTYLYKDPARIPERFFTRLGLQKPRS